MDFKIQSVEQRKFLDEATKRYHLSLSGSPAEEYLASRGLLTPALADDLSLFRIGFVEDPLPGHEWYRNWLAIPYIRLGPETGWSIITMKFRCLELHGGSCADAGHEKYIAHTGGGTHLFNTRAVQTTDHEIAICEGEIDAMTASLNGVPAVGVPGIKNWKEEYYRFFVGYKIVWMFSDGDEYGSALANKLSSRMNNIRVIKMPPKEDVNSMVLKHGKHVLLKGMGRE